VRTQLPKLFASMRGDGSDESLKPEFNLSEE
jgi:hypothetical protein